VIAGGLIPPEADWQSLADHLSKVVGRPVQLIPVSSLAADRADQLRALRDGTVHVAVLSAGRVPTAVDAGGFVPVGLLPAPDGSKWTRVKLIVPADSPLQSPADLRGKQLLFTDPTSNTGFKAVVIALRSEFGLLPERDFTWTFSGGHRESIQAVVDRQAEAAAVSEDLLARAVAAGEVKADAVRSIYQSDPFPSVAVGYAHNLAPDLARRVRDGLMSFDWADTPLQPVLGSPRTRFHPADYKQDWALIRRIDDAIGVVHSVQ
jgi:phosphonate transport system substrate-binding protein